MQISSSLLGLVSPSSVRAPRVRVIANGVPVVGVTDADIASTNHYAADRFSVDVALGADPQLGPAFWASESDISVEVQMSLDGGASFTSLIEGAVDTVDLDPIIGTARVAGRDRTAALIETRTQETFANRTSSEIAQILAARHGLGAQVKQTSTPVGRYYQDEHDRITLDQFSRATTEWDLLVFLARQESFDVFVRGSTLFFQPPSEPDGAIVVLRPVDCLDLRLERALTLARDLEVTVKSWNSRQQNAFTQTARSRAQKSLGGAPQRYVYVRPNLTSDQALKLAQQILTELTRHERVVALTMPGELVITPRSLVGLQGTGTEFDQIYYVDHIERSIRAEGGFVQHIRAKNMSPQSQATPPADIVASVTG